MGAPENKIEKAQRFSTLSTDFSTLDYVNVVEKAYAKTVDIKLVKAYFTGILYENKTGESPSPIANPVGL